MLFNKLAPNPSSSLRQPFYFAHNFVGQEFGGCLARGFLADPRELSWTGWNIYLHFILSIKVVTGAAQIHGGGREPPSYGLRQERVGCETLDHFWKTVVGTGGFQADQGPKWRNL